MTLSVWIGKTGYVCVCYWSVSVRENYQSHVPPMTITNRKFSRTTKITKQRNFITILKHTHTHNNANKNP